MAYSKAYIADVLRKKRAGQSILSLSKQYGISRATITKWSKNKLYSDDTEVNRVLNKMDQIEQESNDDLLEIIKSIQYSNITKNAMKLLTPDNLEEEFVKRGIGKLIVLMGNSFDKALATERLELEKRAMTLKERTLELKEKELNARIENPDAFSNVVIIDDTKEAYKYYQANGMEEQYDNN
jgi:hypothetical protein